MEPETNPPANSEEKVSLSVTDLKALIADAVQTAMALLVKQNSDLQQQVAQASNMTYAEGIPEEFQRADLNVDPRRMSVARSVTVATRCSIENPDQYPNIVDAGRLSINNASPLSPKAMAEIFGEDPNGPG